MDAGITEGRALGWTDHGVSKFGLQRQVLNTKDNSAWMLPGIHPVTPGYCTSGVKEMGDVPQGYVPTELYQHLRIPSSANARVSAEH